MRQERIYLTEDKVAYIDAYIADSGVRDALLIIPGGGYVGVSMFLEGEPIAISFMEKGYNCFALNYHVGANAHYPTQLIDACLAMRYIRENEEKYNINSGRVFAVGFSAGGHLTGALSTMVDRPEIRAVMGEDVSDLRPTAAVLSYPVTTAFEPTHKGSFQNLLGIPYENITNEELAKHSIECAVDEKTPPMYIWHTAEDSCVPVFGSIRLAATLGERGIPFKLSVYPYGPHALGNARAGKYIYPWLDEAAEWMKTIK